MVAWRDGWVMAHTALWSLYFPDGVTVYTNHLVRFVFGMYYLPPIALVLAITHSAIERIVWVLVVPIVQDMEKQPYDSSHMKTFLLGLSNIILRILPFSTLGFAVATVGHKVLNCLVEAMVDAHSSRKGKDYPLLSERLHFIFQDTSRYYTFLIVLFLLVSVVLSGLHTSLLVSWTNREPAMVASTWGIIGIELGFVAVTALRNKPSNVNALCLMKVNAADLQAFGKYFCDIWWETHIHYIRHTAIELAILFSLVSLFFHGPLYVLSTTVEMVMYLNIPHIVGHAVLSISTYMIRLHKSLRWLQRHSDALVPVLLVAMIYQIMLLQAIYYFLHHYWTLLLLFVVNALLIVRAIDLVREFDVTEAGSVHWRRVNEKTLLPPYIAILLEEAFEENLSQVAVVSLDLSMDVKAMKLYDADGEVQVERELVRTRNGACGFLRNGGFYIYTLPRLIAVQSPAYFGGKRLGIARVVFRAITISCLLIYASLVVGMLLQAAFPQLRPWPVATHASHDNSVLMIDHIIVRMQLFSNQANITFIPPQNSSTALTSAAFHWVNTTAHGEDWYPSLCKRMFHGISIWEISLLALASYLFNDEEVEEMLRFMSAHMGSDWVIRERHGTDCVTHHSSTEPTGWTGYFDFYSAKHDVSVVAVRGTDMTSFFDLLTDINIFFDVVLYHLLSNVVPGAVILPSELISDLLRVASVPATTTVAAAAAAELAESWDSLLQSQNTSLRECQNNNYRRDFFADVYNHIVYMGSRSNSPRQVILTGHSLGGSVASIIGSQLGIQAVAFSAPGISLSRKRYGLDLQRIHKYVARITSSHDIFAMIGGTGGEEHHVECLAKTRELCHAMEFLVGTLWRSCGSIRALYPSIASVE